MMKKLLFPLLITTTLIAPNVLAGTFTDNIKLAMASEARTDKEKNRDRNRKPAETLEFFGIKEDMKVLEIIPGGGWYTKLLAPALRDKGQFYLSLGTKRLSENLLTKKPFDKVKAIGPVDYKLDNLDFEVNDLDAVLTFRNYHNFDEKERISINKAAFSALKPGGVYGVVDHTRRHMQKKNEQ